MSALRDMTNYLYMMNLEIFNLLILLLINLKSIYFDISWLQKSEISVQL